MEGDGGGQADRCYQHLIGEVYEIHVCSRDFSSTKITFDILDRLEEAGGLCSREKQRIQLAFHEAIVNAHEHGNLELKSEWREQLGSGEGDRFSEMKAIRLEQPAYAEREIQIRLEFDGSDLVLTVKDQGPGFNPPKMLPPLEGDIHSHGRGIRLIRHFMDVVEYREGGRLLELRKHVIPVPSEGESS